MNKRLRELDFAGGVAVNVDATDVQLAVSRAAKIIPDQIMDAAARVQRKVLGALARQIRDDLARETTLDKPVIAKAIRTKTFKRRMAEVQGAVRVATSRLPLIRYARGISPLRVTAEKGKRPRDWTALSYRLTSEGREYGNSSDQEGHSRLFVAKLRSGHLGVYTRFGGSLFEEEGPSVQFHVASPEKRTRYEHSLIEQFLDGLGQEVSMRGGSL